MGLPLFLEKFDGNNSLALGKNIGRKDQGTEYLDRAKQKTLSRSKGANVSRGTA